MRPIVAIRISVVTSLAVVAALFGMWSQRTPTAPAAQMQAMTEVATTPRSREAPPPEMPDPPDLPDAPDPPDPPDLPLQPSEPPAPTAPGDAASTTLASDCSGPLAVTADRVFWLTPHAIKSMALDGKHATTLVEGELSLLRVDRGQIFFTANDSGAIERVNVDGSRRSVLAPDQHPSSMAVDGAWVYWTSGVSSIWRVARDGGAPQTLGTDSAEIAEIAVAGGRIYMDTDAGIHSLPITGGTLREDVAVAFPMGIAVANGRAAWSSGSLGTIGEIAGGRNRTVFEAKAGHTDRLAYHRASGALVFVVTSDDRTEIRAASGNRSRVLARVEGRPIDLAVNDRYAYWTEDFSADKFRNEPYAGGCAIRRLTLPRWK